MRHGFVRSFSTEKGWGTVDTADGWVNIHRVNQGIHANGYFRRYALGEFKPTPVAGQEVSFILCRDNKVRAHRWSLPEVPVQKIIDVVKVGQLEFSRLISFRRERNFGFVLCPYGGEDLMVHVGEVGVYEDGKLERIPGSRMPCEGEEIAFVRDANNRIETWAIVHR